MSLSTTSPQDRFVILFHQFPDVAHASLSKSLPKNRLSDHWDLMFEWEGELWTWASESDPFKSDNLLAVELPRHRLEYLNYEGPVSGDRGKVRRVLDGTYSIITIPISLSETPSEEPSKAPPKATPQSLPHWVELGRFQLALRAGDRKYQAQFLRKNRGQSAKLVEWEIQLTAAER